MPLRTEAERTMRRLTEELSELQSTDGAWRLCMDNGPMTDAFMIIILCALELDEGPLIRRLAQRLVRLQQANGAWRLFDDETDGGNLSATIEAYFALMYAGIWQADDEAAQRAKDYIIKRGGLENASLLTKVILALNGQYPWRNPFLLPIEIILTPDLFPFDFYDIAGYARVHIVPVLIAARRKFSVVNNRTPSMTELSNGSVHRLHSTSDDDDPGVLKKLLDAGINGIKLLPQQLEKLALQRAERYMLDRIEPDGTYYSYTSSTILMIYALLALGRSKRDPHILKAVYGLKSFVCERTAGNIAMMQNFTSSVWDTALISGALQIAGVPVTDPIITKAGRYLLSRQHVKPGDWRRHNPVTEPGGWGFSDINTMNPDIDDTTAALRAIHGLVRTGGPEYLSSWNRGLNWLLSMQNSDGGWPSFERNTDLKLLTWLPVEHAADALVDPSSADLTGRTLEFLGHTAGFRTNLAFVSKAVKHLLTLQEQEGSWYSRWGVCYIYGTWAALTGLRAVGVSESHPAVLRAASWLQSVQLSDGGFGESCRSDKERRFVPLGWSTPSQTAWAIDALLAVYGRTTPFIDRAVSRLIELIEAPDVQSVGYPTGAGLPGEFYLHYESYRRIWPLMALSAYLRLSST